MKSLEAVQKIYKVLEILCKVAFVLCIVGIAGCLIGGCAVLALDKIPDSILDMFADGIAFKSMSSLALYIFSAGVSVVAGTVIAWYSYKYCKNELADGTPFSHRGADELKRLGIISLVASALGSIVVSILLSAGDIKSSSMSQIDIGFGITAILLSFVFRYGAELEKKSVK